MRRPDLTTVPLVVERALHVAAPAERALAVLADPASTAFTAGEPGGFGFVVPGTPAGAVGERRVVVHPDPWSSALIAAVADVVDVVPGRRVVVLPRGAGRPLRRTMTAEPTGPDSCVLRVALDAFAPASGIALMQETLGPELEHALAAVAHHLGVGPPPAPPHESVVLRNIRKDDERRAWRSAGVPRVTVRVHASVDVAAPPLRAWLAVLDARHDHWWQHDPDAVAFTVPGTPSGQVGELRCVVAHGSSGLEATFAETVAVDEGAAFVTRDRGFFAGVRTTWVEPATGGTRVTREAVLDLLDGSPEAHARQTAALGRGLDALVRHLTA
ncbi:SRPBCC family protein [Actinotalea ferrariae]|uniref:SRPBCC family protein n=1 Tax=Actinotalea ferrariae TaxID=1386098 RepID=UPI001C8B7CAC|nr:SRPBCC family protein [Actinotalea ferrariae]MBX9244055.1 SRPBCC family protein [Actinotalea ferrariae]